MKYKLLSLLLLLFALGCSSNRGVLPPSAAWGKVAKGAVLVDVRSESEFRSGHLPGALHIPYDEIGERATELGPHHGREIVLYCRSGRRSGIAEEKLRELGFSNAYNAGGYEELKAAKVNR